MTERARRWLWSVGGGVAATFVATLGAAYLSVVDRGPEWARGIAILLSLGLTPFWQACGILTPIFHGPTPWVLAAAALINVGAWAVAIHLAAIVVRRVRVR